MRVAIPILFLFFSATIIVLLFPPSNIFVILLLVTVLSLAFALFLKIFLKRKYAWIGFLSIFIFLNLKALELIDPINLMLAIALLTSIFILIK